MFIFFCLNDGWVPCHVWRRKPVSQLLATVYAKHYAYNRYSWSKCCNFFLFECSFWLWLNCIITTQRLRLSKLRKKRWSIPVSYPTALVILKKKSRQRIVIDVRLCAPQRLDNGPTLFLFLRFLLIIVLFLLRWPLNKAERQAKK